MIADNIVGKNHRSHSMGRRPRRGPTVNGAGLLATVRGQSTSTTFDQRRRVGLSQAGQVGLAEREVIGRPPATG